MYCIKCGADNSETASYCRKCGDRIESEEETRVAVRRSDEHAASVNPSVTDDDEELPIFAISPTLKFVKSGYALAGLAAILLVAVTAAFTSIATIWAVVAGLMLFLIPAYYHVRQKLIRYTLTDSKLEIDEGLISRKTRSIPLRRIQDVTVSASVAQRLLGFGDLMIDNATDDVGKIVLKNINSPRHYADVLLRQMRQLDRARRDDL